jgi:uncharacterized membrane protein
MLLERGMITMTEPSENILRKTLDAVDRRQRWMKVLAVAFFVLGGGNTALAMVNLQDMRLLYIATFVGMVLWTGGLALAIMSVSYRNARLILRAIMLVPQVPHNLPSSTYEMNDNHEPESN